MKTALALTMPAGIRLIKTPPAINSIPFYNVSANHYLHSFFFAFSSIHVTSFNTIMQNRIVLLIASINY